MNEQGTPVGSTAQVMKYIIDILSENTTDSEALHNPTLEGPGAITSDSLAAKSANAGGLFSENRNSEPLSVPGSSSIFSNTDTSGATELGPTPDAAEREAKEAWQQASDEAKGPGGAKYPEGAYIKHLAFAVVDLALTTRAKTMTRVGRGGNPDSSDANSAPSYVNSVQSQSTQSGKLKVENLSEGVLNDDPSNSASFPSDIGTQDDPGRASENEMQRNTQAASGPTGPRQKMGEGDNSQYGALQDEQNL